MPSASEEREERLDAIIAEVLESVERGASPDLAALLRTHPDLADELRIFFQDWRQFQHAATHVSAAACRLPSSNADGGPGQIGNYQVLEQIARGGMGVVYKARQLPLNRTVALKMLLWGASSTDEEVRRFQAEAEAAAQLDHAGIVPIYEVGQHEGLPFFSMRYVGGENLADLVARGPLPPREAARLVREIAVALEFAHQRHVVHRDLKPSNVLLEWPDGSGSSNFGRDATALATHDLHHAPRPLITDFGLAKRLAPGNSYTQSGQVLGTPNYMSPEQIAGPQAIGPLTDIYSLGAILYCLLTGRPPFQAADPLETLRQVRDSEPVPPTQLIPSTPPDLETIALRCLEKRPERRFDSAGALVQELDRFLAGRPILTRPVGWCERVGRWAMRQPVIAALTVAIASAVLLGTGSSLYFGVQASRRAHEERQRRLDLEASLYRSRVMQADLEWQTNNVNRADQLLNACDPARRNWEWSFLKRRCHPEQFECHGHTAAVRQVVYSPDGRRLVSAGTDSTVRLWDAKTGAVQSVWNCDASAMTVAWSADGNLVAAGQDDGQVVVWEVSNGRRRFAVKIHDGGVSGVLFHPDSQSLASCGDDAMVKFSDAMRGGTIREWKAEASATLCMAIDREGTRIAAAGDGEVISIWDTTSGALLHSLPTGPQTTRSLAFTLDGQRLISAYESSVILTWNIATAEVRSTFEEHSAPVRALAIGPDGATAVSGAKDGTILVWEVASGDLVRSWKAHHLSVFGVAFHPNGLELASCGVDNLVRVWDVESPAAVPRSWAHTDRVNEVAFSPSGDLVASASKDGTVRLWDAQTAEERGVCIGHEGMVLAVAFGRNGQWLASTGVDGRVLRWETKSGRLLDEVPGDGTPLWSVDVRSDSPWLVISGENGLVRLWDIDRRQEIRKFSAHVGDVKCVRFSPNGTHIASCGDDAIVRLWDVESGQQVRTMEHHRGSVWQVAFSRDGQQLASSGSDGTVAVWSVATGELIQTCVGHAGIVYAAAFSPDRSRLATAGFDETVKIWDLTTGLDLLTLRGPLWSVNSVAFSPDGKTVASGGSDWRVRLWHAKGR